MPGCAVASCKNTDSSKPGSFHYHSFPKDPRLQQVWVLKCRRLDKVNPINARVCSNHFTPEDYERDLKSELLGLKKKPKLKKDAVPSLNLVSATEIRPLTLGPYSKGNARDRTNAAARSQRQEKREIRKRALERIKNISLEKRASVTSPTDECSDCEAPPDTEGPECCAPNCSKRSNDGVKLFRFPSDSQLGQLWCQNSGRMGPIPVDAQLCELHFDITQYENYINEGRQKLRADAVPTLFDGVSILWGRLGPVKSTVSSIEHDTAVKVEPSTTDSAATMNGEPTVRCTYTQTDCCIPMGNVSFQCPNCSTACNEITKLLVLLEKEKLLTNKLKQQNSNLKKKLDRAKLYKYEEP